MNCREFLSHIAGTELHSREAAEHLGECAACRSAAVRDHRLEQGLHALAAEWRDLEAPPRVEAAMLAAYRGHMGLAGRAGRTTWPRAFLLAAAAAILVAAALMLMQYRRPNPRVHHRTGPELAIVQAVDLESMDAPSGFIPLPNAGQIDANEQTDVVRVELPRTAMAALGYAVTPDQSEDTVEADVMLGADGAVRAVRFLDGF